MSRTLYRVFLILWAIVLLITIFICIKFTWFVGLILPFVVVGITTMCTIPITKKVFNKPFKWSVLLILLLHIFAVVVVLYLNPNPESSFYKMLVVLMVLSTSADIFQITVILKWKQIINYISQQRKEVCIFLCTIGAIVVTTAVVKTVFFPTTWQYCDMMIIGGTVDEVIERYGKFDKVFYYVDSENISSAGYFLDNGKGAFGNIRGFDSYYMIHFNEAGEAVSVKIDGGWGG